MEHILVNRIRLKRTTVSESLAFQDDEVTQIVIALSGIVTVRPITTMNYKIKMSDITPEMKNKILGMSLETDLGGSRITFIGARGTEFIETLETPEAIYRKMEKAQKDFVLVHFVEGDKPNREIKQVLLRASKILSVKEGLLLGNSISYEDLSDEEWRQVEKFVSKDEIGGSRMGYYNEADSLQFTDILETPVAIYNRMYTF